MNLLGKRLYYKPFKYDWAYEGWEKQQKMHWLVEEISMSQDVLDWNTKMTAPEKNLLTQIFRFFTQADVDVANAYTNIYIPLLGGQPEVKMMMTAFANMETIHIAAYSHLLDTIGMPETTYKAFLEFEAMRAKHSYVANFDRIWEVDHENSTSIDEQEEWHLRDIAQALAVYSAFTEGMQLFSSFVILLNFARFNKMKGMCQVVTFSIRDETLHTDYMIKLFRQFIKENRSIWTDDFKGEIYQICREMVDLEDRFIDLAFEQGGIEGLTAEEVKLYIRYIADRRLLSLGLKANYGIKKNPLEWVDWLVNGVEHANFFELKSTEYTKAATKGTWDEVYKQIDNLTEGD